MSCLNEQASRARRLKLPLYMVLALAAGSSLAQDLEPLDCVTKPYQTVDLASSVPGVLDKVYVAKSDFIEQGEIAATLEAGVERASVVLAGARAAIESEVQVNSVNLEFDRRRMDRMEALYEKKSVSIELKEEAEREHSLSRWRLQQAKDLKQIRKLELDRAEAQLQQKTIRTPFAGFVLEQFKGAGEYVEDQPIMRIVQLDPLYVIARVPFEQHSAIAKGMQAQVFPEATPGQSLDAVVAVIDRVGDATSGTFGIGLTLPNPDYKVLAGMKCMLKFSGSGGRR